MRLFKIFFKSFLSLFAVMRMSGMQPANPLSLVLFAVFLYVFAQLQEERFEGRVSMADSALSCILGVLFSMFTLAVCHPDILTGFTSPLFCLILLALTAFGLFTIYYHLVAWLLQASGLITLTGAAYQRPWLPCITVVLCLLCWLPHFLYQYPGVMTPDSINQYAQILGVYELSNHHSVIHTLLLGMFYRIGLYFTGDVSFGLALCTLTQMLFMALVAGYVVRTLQKADVIFPVILAVIGFYALMPYHGAYAVTLWKDIPFAGAMTLFCAALLRFLLRPKSGLLHSNPQKLAVSEYFTLLLPYVFSGIMISLLRTNGWYAFLATLPFILFIYRKNWRLMIPVHLIILLFVLFVKYPCMNIYEIKQADFVESLSVPLQQIACVVASGESLTQEEWDFVGSMMDLEQVPAQYRPDVSDNIKNLVRQKNPDYLETHKSAFFKTWLSIGLAHPKSYFDAYVAQTKGYWYPDVSYTVGLDEGIYPNEFGLTWQPILRGGPVVKIREILFKLHELFPLYGALWSMGMLFWVILVIAAVCLRTGEVEKALVCLPCIALVLTLCIAAPVATEFRYAYPLFYGLPLFLVAPFVQSEG
ncbi:MAG: DUF6020 family protein [Roseburia sp.]|nr:DUF6020 family protein [Roseburia sp.]